MQLRFQSFLTSNLASLRALPYVGQDCVRYIVYIRELTPCLSKSEPVGEPSLWGEKEKKENKKKEIQERTSSVPSPWG